MTPPAGSWIELSQRRPAPGQFVRVEVRERVESHWIEFEGQARFADQQGWLSVDGEPYLSENQEIRRWKPLLDSASNQEFDELDDLVGELAKD